MKSSTLARMPIDNLNEMTALVKAKMDRLINENPKRNIIRTELPDGGFSYACLDDDDNLVAAGSLTCINNDSYIFVACQSEEQ